MSSRLLHVALILIALVGCSAAQPSVVPAPPTATHSDDAIAQQLIREGATQLAGMVSRVTTGLALDEMVAAYRDIHEFANAQTYSVRLLNTSPCMAEAVALYSEAMALTAQFSGDYLSWAETGFMGTMPQTLTTDIAERAGSLLGDAAIASKNAGC